MTTNSGGMLVAAPDRWDEACFAVPALRALVASGVGVGVVCTEEQQEFWRTIHGLEVQAYVARSRSRSLAKALQGKWKTSLAWEPGIAAEAFKLAGIENRLGPGERRLAKWLTHPLKEQVGPLEHRVRHYLVAVEELGIDAKRPEFFAPAALGIIPQPGTVLLCPGSDFGPNHEWPVDRWLELARRLIEHGRQVTIAGVDGGRGLGVALANALGGDIEYFQAAPLAGALPVLAVHETVISADGSLPHLAAHAGATCVTLFGPNDPAWRRPLGRRHEVVWRHVECAPCLLPKCPLDLRCQRELEIDRVWPAVLAALRN